MSETLVERIKRWNETKPNDIMQAFSSDLYDIVKRAEQAEAERDETNNAVMQATKYAHDLEAERDQLREALAPFAKLAHGLREHNPYDIDRFDKAPDEQQTVFGDYDYIITIGHLRKAIEALK